MIGVRRVTHAEKETQEREGEDCDHMRVELPRGPRADAPTWNLRRPRIPGAGFVQQAPYGLMVWSGTPAIVFLHTTGSIRQGPVLPPRSGTVMRVVPVATLGGTSDGSPFTTVSSAAREQF